MIFSMAGPQALNRTVTTITSVWCQVLTSHFHSSFNTVNMSTHMVQRVLVCILQINTLALEVFLRQQSLRLLSWHSLGGPITAVPRGLEVHAYPSSLPLATIPPAAREGPGSVTGPVCDLLGKEMRDLFKRQALPPN